MGRNCAMGKTRGRGCQKRGRGRGRGRAKGTHQEMVHVSDEDCLQHKVSGPLSENTKNLTSSDSSKSECGSSMIRSERSEDMQLSIPTDLSEDLLAQTQVTVASPSFNLTDVAMDEDDEDGIESSIHPALVDVKGYRVRSEIAPTLHQILEQHGDIAKDSNGKVLRECFLEKVCYIYERLQRSSFQAIKSDELFKMGETIDAFEHMGFNVNWLRERLYEILKPKVFLKVFLREITGHESQGWKKNNPENA